MMTLVADGEIKKDQQFNGFRQAWFERRDGVFHGTYTVYWQSGPLLCMRGQYVDGAQDGLWTYWDENGRLTHQSIFRQDEEIETRTAPPWLGGAADQEVA
jgi:antitoxin component YwqK of YwqJK toxin-antitoxin module